LCVLGVSWGVGDHGESVSQVRWAVVACDFVAS
jgi:hypothetical protein